MNDTVRNEKKGKKPEKGKAAGGFARFRKDWIEPIGIAIILVFLIKTFIVQNYRIPSSSMEDTLLVGDRLFASKFIYGAAVPFTDRRFFKVRDPKPGDIVVFKYPEDPSKDYIKRCIAVDGQTVEIRDKEVYVDGKQVKLPSHAKFIDNNILPARFGIRDNMPPTRVPDGMLFVMGDNRDNSSDSRFWGFLPVDNLRGKALIVYWSINPDVPLFDIVHKIRWSRCLQVIR